MTHQLFVITVYMKRRYECAKGDHEDDCVGTEKPTIDLINPTSHTDTRPVWFLDEEKGECFRSLI